MIVSNSWESDREQGLHSHRGQMRQCLFLHLRWLWRRQIQHQQHGSRPVKMQNGREESHQMKWINKQTQAKCTSKSIWLRSNFNVKPTEFKVKVRGGNNIQFAKGSRGCPGRDEGGPNSNTSSKGSCTWNEELVRELHHVHHKNLQAHISKHCSGNSRCIRKIWRKRMSWQVIDT
jgi:hypothetical protein